MGKPGERLRGQWLRWAVVLLVFSVGGCGGRTGLRGSFACHNEGEIAPCVRGCAQGTMVCEEGLWSTCDLTPTSRACENSCGAGIQQCVDEKWAKCEVEPVVEVCTNTCGEGTRSCALDSWSECQVEPVVETCTFGCGDGSRSCVDNSWSECDAPRREGTVITATVRDFSASHPDMERFGRGEYEPGMVAEQLGADGTPVYLWGETGTESSSGASNFYQWYHDSDVSQKTTVPIPLTLQRGSDEFYEYVDRGFFPIDDQLLGNETNRHNYHFTLEAHEAFIYREGQVFNFEGDDDMWVFINKSLVIDLGGLHQAMSAWVELDHIADKIGIVPGGTYAIDIFFAERHTIESNFIIRTSISGLGECVE